MDIYKKHLNEEEVVDRFMVKNCEKQNRLQCLKSYKGYKEKS